MYIIALASCLEHRDYLRFLWIHKSEASSASSSDLEVSQKIYFEKRLIALVIKLNIIEYYLNTTALRNTCI